MKKLFVVILGVWLFGCSKDEKPVNNGSLGHEQLTLVKSGVNGNIILNENIYAPGGQIKTRIDYKNYSLGLISSKAELTYNDGRLVQIETQMDFSSSASATQYVYSKAALEYNNNGLVVQRNNYLKVNGEFNLSSFTVFTYNDQRLPSRENRFTPDGTLYSYSTFEYDAAGNVTEQKDYHQGQPGASPVLTQMKRFEYDDKNNPYKVIYQPIENIPFSVNANNIVKTTVVNYTINPQGISSTSATSYPSYNSKAYRLA